VHKFFLKLNLLVGRLKIKHILVLYGLLVVGFTLQCYLISIGKEYTRYNNYVIFKQSFSHLINLQNLYILHPSDHYDLFKYSPTFSLFMGLFYPLPDFIGLLLFNLLNISVFVYAISRLKLSVEKQKLALLFLFVESGISLASAQTNLLMAGLLILAFCHLEKDNILVATLFISLTFFIKIFGVVGFALWLLYPKKIKFAFYSIGWILVLALLPLIVLSPQELLNQYYNWGALLKNDHTLSTGISFMGILSSWFGATIDKLLFVCLAALLFCMPFIRISLYKEYLFRAQIVASILLWIVIFNHKGESPTYVIALAGVAIWYFSQNQDRVNTVLIWLALIFTSFSSTDAITPLWITSKYIDPFSIKALFCSIIWFKLIWDLTTQKKMSQPVIGTNSPR
jgi:Glycosyltransferase family 87